MSKVVELLNQLSDVQIYKKDSTPCSWLREILNLYLLFAVQWAYNCSEYTSDPIKCGK
jgi:hypothetical protein